MVNTLSGIIDTQEQSLKSTLAGLSAQDAELISMRIDTLKDTQWCLDREILQNIEAISG